MAAQTQSDGILVLPPQLKRAKSDRVVGSPGYSPSNKKVFTCDRCNELRGKDNGTTWSNFMSQYIIITSFIKISSFIGSHVILWFIYNHAEIAKFDGIDDISFMAFLEFVIAFCAFLQIQFSDGKQGSIVSPSGSIMPYILLSFLCTILSIISIQFWVSGISYPTLIIFKGTDSKVVLNVNRYRQYTRK